MCGFYSFVNQSNLTYFSFFEVYGNHQKSQIFVGKRAIFVLMYKTLVVLNYFYSIIWNVVFRLGQIVNDLWVVTFFIYLDRTLLTPREFPSGNEGNPQAATGGGRHWVCGSFHPEPSAFEADVQVRRVNRYITDSQTYLLQLIF